MNIYHFCYERKKLVAIKFQNYCSAFWFQQRDVESCKEVAPTPTKRKI